MKSHRVIRVVVIASAIAFALVTIGVASIWLWIRPDLRRLDERIASARSAPVHSRIVPAIVAIEDPGLFRRSGMITIAGFWSASKRVYASTLQNQLVVMTLSRQRSATRVAKSLLLTTILEARGKPDDIAQAYASSIYLGSAEDRPLIGVRDAAQAYFGRSAEELSPAQIAMLLSVIRYRSAYAPSGTSAAAIDRRLRVLQIMREQRVITEHEFDGARREILGNGIG